jgi:hypothetical protein
MKILSLARKNAHRTLLKAMILFAAIPLVLSVLANAAPITYTALTITDGSLGSWTFHNARVYISFETDTSNVQVTQIAGVNVVYVGPFPAQQLCTGPATSIGTARVTIVSGDRRVHATFAPNQLFVSLDRDNGGVGIGSCGPNGFEPAYPFGISDGTIDAAADPFAGIVDANNPSPELAGLGTDLVSNVNYSGRANVCVGFPTGNAPCKSPNPLHTDKGDLLLYQPYQLEFPQPNPAPPGFGDTLSGGWFYVQLGGNGDSEDESISPRWSSSGEEEEDGRPITYTGFVITDVQIGPNFYGGAQIYLSLRGNTRRVVPLPNETCPSLSNSICGYMNDGGDASVRVVSSGHTITAHLAPHQIYAFFDISTASAGFGSHVGGQDYRAYPLTLTKHDLAVGSNFCPIGNGCSLVENSLVGSVADIATNGDTQNYTPETATLTTDLKTPTTVSGAASSCTAFDPTTSICSSPTVVALQSDLGAVYLFEPYTDDETSGNGSQPFSVNWGAFWVERN